jgi:hypothetical protein
MASLEILRKLWAELGEVLRLADEPEAAGPVQAVPGDGPVDNPDAPGGF